MIAIDLFSGVGGMALGFERAGFNVKAAFDFEANHVVSYSVNFPNTIIRQINIECLTKGSIFDAIPSNEHIDIVFGGPPCQGFSVGGKGLVEDTRNELINEFARVVCELKPRAFVIENVSGILSPKYKDILTRFYKTLRGENYIITDPPLLLSAADYGVPQLRKRVFIIGLRKKALSPSLPTPIYSDEPAELTHPKVWHAISDLPTLDNLDYLYDNDRFSGELGTPSLYATELRKPRETHPKINSIGGFLKTRHSDSVLARFAATKPGTTDPISRFKRLDFNGIAPTLRAGTTRAYGHFMAPRPIHPIENRVITVREAARLHSFPDWFEFYPTKWYGFMQIGNSVPPLLAEAVARHVIRQLS